MGNQSTNTNNFSSHLGKQVMSSFIRPVGAREINHSHRVNNVYSTPPRLPSTNEELTRKVDKLESLLNLYSDLYKQSGREGKIDEVPRISGKSFFDNYYFNNKPVILKSMMQDWPAIKKWNPDYFLSAYGHVPIEITKGRESEQSYEKNFRKTIATIPFGEFIDKIKKSPSNDLYLVARNYFFSNPQFHALRTDVNPPGEIIDATYTGLQSMKLWFGPSGTVTPLHHDKHSILFCQVYGRKHFKMIPSFDLPNIYNKDRYYSDIDPEHVDLEKYPLFNRVSVANAILNPGDMLFIPVGWWHWVKSLEISISVTFSNFRVAGYNTQWNCE